MGFSSVAGKLTILVVTLMVVTAPYAAEAISCVQVTVSVLPCIAYLQTGGAPSPACCSGVKSLNSAAKTTADRRAACSCVNALAKTIPGLNGGFVSSLPGKCGVNLGYTIRLNMDCSKVN